jgi:hypothetical protein
MDAQRGTAFITRFELDLDVLGEYFLTQVCPQLGIECTGGERIWAVAPV